MNIEVHKYGGTSVGDLEKIQSIARKTIDYQRQNNVKVILVLSAMGNTTNQLLLKAQQLAAAPEPQHLDQLLSTGELMSCSLMAVALAQAGCCAEVLSASQAGITTNNCFGHAQIQRVDVHYIRQLIKRDILPIVTGFQGQSLSGHTTTLGRGGSDITALVLAAELKAKCYIFTDVAGVYSADPRYIASAQLLANISIDAMLLMAKLGAQVLHPKAVIAAKNGNVDLYVLNAHDNQSLHFSRIGQQRIAAHQCRVCVVVDADVLSIQWYPEESSQQAKQLIQQLRLQSDSVEIMGGNHDGCSAKGWQIIVSRHELSWCIAQLNTVPSKYFLEEGFAKVSMVCSALQKSPQTWFEAAHRLMSEQHIAAKYYSLTHQNLTVIVNAARAQALAAMWHEHFNTILANKTLSTTCE